MQVLNLSAYKQNLNIIRINIVKNHLIKSLIINKVYYKKFKKALIVYFTNDTSIIVAPNSYLFEVISDGFMVDFKKVAINNLKINTPVMQFADGYFTNIYVKDIIPLQNVILYNYTNYPIVANNGVIIKGFNKATLKIKTRKKGYTEFIDPFELDALIQKN